MDAAAAAARLARMVASEVDPVLDAAALADLLVLSQRPDANGNLPTNLAAADDWAAATVYAPGDVVQPDPNDGRWWVCVFGGTSAATQPSWPDLGGEPRTAHMIVDGTVTWGDAGAAWAPTWDLAAGAVEGWEQKAALASGRFEFTTDGQTFRGQQVVAHCQAQADRYRRKMGAAVVDP
jgi:hypothetical protein